MSRKILEALLLLAVSSILNAQFYTVKTYDEIDTVLARNHKMLPVAGTWIITDLDNTVFTPDVSTKDKDALKYAEQATDGFYYRNKNKIFKELAEKRDEKTAKILAYRRAVDEWNAIVPKAPMRLVLPQIAEWFKVKQKAGYITMGHTAREVVLEDVTVMQLSKLGVLFRNSAPAALTVQLPAEEPLHPELAVYRNGIFFVGRGGIATKHHKGRRFMQLLSKWREGGEKKRPKTVIFIDDRDEHVKGMVAELEAEGIPCLGFHLIAIAPEAEIHSIGL